MLGTIEVSEIGIGCMAFSHGYGQIPDHDYSVDAIRNAFDHGCTFFDTAEIYSPGLAGIGHNELIVGEALKDVRERTVIATKLFIDCSDVRRDGSVYNAVKRHLTDSMSRLNTDMVDLYYLHRLSSSVRLEEIAEAMGRLIGEGMIRGWGLSQVDVDVIQKAHRVTPVSAVQNIYSMVERDCEKKVIPFCLENNIGFVPFSPIASGLLSGKITAETKFESYDDVRNWVPQLSKRNIQGNMPIVDLLREYADMKNASPAQISLAWMLKKYPNVVPIPGSKNKGRMIENLDASKLELSDEEFRTLETSLNRLKVYGHRGFTR